MLARSLSTAAFAVRRSGATAAPSALRSSFASAAAATATAEPVRVTIARGDGIGPEIMEATLRVMEAAKVDLEYDEIEIGENVYLAGHTSGIKPSDWDTLRRNPAFLKAPITTPVGKGYKSLNVSIRKTLGLYANVRPTVSLMPYVSGKPNVDLVCVRENEEDTYAGIEHQQTPEVVQCLKLISRPGCERIARYAFEYALANNRKRVTLFHKANIMKLTDGMFLDVAREVYAAEYEGMFKLDDIIVDIGTALLADTPERFDVVCMPNLYGDIASDVIAQVVGSVGLGGSANIGDQVSMFEAIHGSAPDIAGKQLANPTGLILGAVQMLQHVGRPKQAAAIQNAWLKTIEDGIHTGDIFDASSGHSKVRASTGQFTDAIIERLGQKPAVLPVADFSASINTPSLQSSRPKGPGGKYAPQSTVRELHGVDVFVFWPHTDPDKLAEIVLEATRDISSLDLRLITSRGVKVWPAGMPETKITDHWRCRFRASAGADEAVDREAVLSVIGKVARSDAEVIKTENLYLFDHAPGFSLGQGE